MQRAKMCNLTHVSLLLCPFHSVIILMPAPLFLILVQNHSSNAFYLVMNIADMYFDYILQWMWMFFPSSFLLSIVCLHKLGFRLLLFIRFSCSLFPFSQCFYQIGECLTSILNLQYPAFINILFLAFALFHFLLYCVKSF